MYIYIDVIFVINLLMNFLILWAAARIMRVSYTYWRIFLGASLGAVYIICTIIFPHSFLQTFLFKGAVSILMIAVSFNIKSLRQFCQVLFCFYLVALLAGGSAFGIYYLSGDYILSFTEFLLSQWWPILSGILVVLLAGSYGWDMVQKRFFNKLSLVTVEIYYKDQVQKVKALVDTGHQLRDPLTNIPVIVTELKAVEKILPKDAKKMLKEGCKKERLFPSNDLGDSSFLSRFRIIPFAALGTEKGMLNGFRPDKAEVLMEQVLTIDEIVVCIYDHSLCEDESYNALISPEIFQDEFREDLTHYERS